jgi:hypothetical protein
MFFYCSTTQEAAQRAIRMFIEVVVWSGMISTHQQCLIMLVVTYACGPKIFLLFPNNLEF